jgi:hypothetical protein
MESKEQNWKNFCAQNLRELPGLWTGYTPLKESYSGLFNFLEAFKAIKSRPKSLTPADIHSLMAEQRNTLGSLTSVGVWGSDKSHAYRTRRRADTWTPPS